MLLYINGNVKSISHSELEITLNVRKITPQHLLEWLKYQAQTIPNVGKDVEQQEHMRRQYHSFT